MIMTKPMINALIQARKSIPCMIAKGEVDLGRQSYKYATISDVKAAVGPVLEAAGLGFSIGVVPGSCRHEWADIKAKNGTTTQLLFTCEYQMSLLCLEDGSAYTETWPGVGLDPAGEKAPGIAASYALRTWLTNLLMIPIWEEEPEQRHNEEPQNSRKSDKSKEEKKASEQKNESSDDPESELRQKALDMLEPHVTSGRMTNDEAKDFYAAISGATGAKLQAYVHVANRYSDPAYRWRTAEQSAALGKIYKEYEAKDNKSAFTEALKLITGQTLVTTLSQAEAELAINRLSLK